MEHLLLENVIKPSMNEYMGQVFEDVSLQFLRWMNVQDKLPFTFKMSGKWWGNNPLKKREEEIDIVAYDEENILLGECNGGTNSLIYPCSMHSWKRELCSILRVSTTCSFKSRIHAESSGACEGQR